MHVGSLRADGVVKLEFTLVIDFHDVGAFKGVTAVGWKADPSRDALEILGVGQGVAHSLAVFLDVVSYLAGTLDALTDEADRIPCESGYVVRDGAILGFVAVDEFLGCTLGAG